MKRITLLIIGLIPFLIGQTEVVIWDCEYPSLPGSDTTGSVTIEDSVEAGEGDWDVTAPFGPTFDLDFSTTEGTWMSCDVSPDGREIIFDLLGDVYSIPIVGGEAKALTSGPAWDVQPVFSPDGKSIAFTSDRGGGDNIWLMDRDGSNPRAVTKEKFRLLNNPVFTPDGQYIVARKHFVKSRSLGAGEMWMFHISGGKGVQVAEKRDWQHDAGEPDISPDGRYLYYSQDKSPGKRFEYNRNPYETIYAIERIDLVTGEKIRLVSGPGGAATPQISPDGDELAFVRRVGLKTVLFIKDLNTGNERPVFDDLNRDAQETWAIFGVHPGFSWTPDGKHIVISAKGRFWTIDVQSGEATLIPFNASVHQTLTEAVHFPVDIGNPSFDIHVLRHVRVGPEEKRVVVQALGKLYRMNRNGSDRKRLTRFKTGFEFQPAWSPDGKKVAFVRWQDGKAAGIYIADIRKGKAERLKLPPGHYFDPAWSTDGKRIAYRRGGGNWLRGYQHTAEPGIYVVSVKGGPPRKVTKSGRKPVFSSDGNRLLLLDSEGEDKALISVDLNGQDRRILATSENAGDMTLSPDGKWIAFLDRYRVYAAAYPSTGKALKLSPSLASVPVTQLSRDAGVNLHWSRDSKTVYWSLGSELYSRHLKNSFKFIEGAPDSLPELDTTGINLGWSEPVDTPDGTIALVGARIISMEGDQVIENGTLLIEGNRIRAVGPVNEIDIPENAKKIAIPGKTIIPGLVDVHAHIRVNWDGLSSEQNWQYQANLAFGVTTTHDPSNNTEMIFANSEMQKSGRILAPRLFSTGTILYGAETPFKAEINSLEDARSHLRRLKVYGAFSVKSYNQPRRDQRQQVLKAARELEMMVYPEGGSMFQHNMNMVLDGHTGIEHSISVSPLYKDVLTLYGESGVGYTPTLIVSYGGLWGENYWYQHQKVFEHKHLLAFTPPELLDMSGRRRMKVETEDYNFIENSRAAKELSDAGVEVNNGAHGQLQGLGVHWEMWMLVQGGMTPMEALRASTFNGAKYLGMNKDLGSLAAGKLADLVVLGKNPLEDIQNSDSVEMVMLNGRLYDARTLNEQATGDRVPGPFWWEK